ncbi:MAG: RluA family pseudouridine synthase [Bacillales bacterium]|jgi:23S rRNA pseudouridine1911/1915/1917 synthase|nr:RluA family pseudouridine synthase [Bacillales bacterium]
MKLVLKTDIPLTFEQLCKKYKLSGDLIYSLVGFSKIKKYQIINTDIEVELPKEESNILPIDEPLNIVYEDPYFLVLNKPTNLVCIPTINKKEKSLAGMVINYFKNNNISSTAHFVSRLDRNTQGLLIVAKHQYIHHLFSLIKIEKHYKALVNGYTEDNGIIETPILRLPHQNERIIDSKGKYCKTIYKTIERKNNTSLVDIQLLTGRTHQIRVHFKSINHCLVGDTLYGDTKGEFFLISYKLSFKHPITNQQLEFVL